MLLQMDVSLGNTYTSNSQKARIITEAWVGENLFCTCCGNLSLNSYENNRQVADFFCEKCSEQYELKSKNGMPSKSISDGAYHTMINRLNSNTNPNLFFLDYDKNYVVNNFILIPKYFFTEDIIEERKPLSNNAKRAGWVGCNILFTKIPKTGIITVVQNGQQISPNEVTNQWQKTHFLHNQDLKSRGWLLDVMKIIESLGKTEFTLEDIYAFEDNLYKKYPQNNHIKDKIRQQLQILRDKNYLTFINRGNYKLV
jgi:type II restriction enzyme